MLHTYLQTNPYKLSGFSVPRMFEAEFRKKGIMHVN